MKTKIESQYSIIQNTIYILKLIIKKDKMLLLLLSLEALTGVLLPFFSIYLPKLVIDALIAKSTIQHIVMIIGGFSILIAVVYFLHHYITTVRYWHSNFLRMNSMWELFKKTLYCDYENIESATGQICYQKALNSLSGGDWSGISRMIPAILGLTVGLLGFLLYSDILSKLNWLIILLLLCTSSINYFVLRYSRNYEHHHKDDWAPIDKKLSYIENMSSDFSAGKDIRLFDMKQWFLDSRDIFLAMRSEWDRKVENRRLVTGFVNTITILLRDGLAYLYLIYMLANKNITVGDFVLYFGAITGFSNWITQLINQANEISSASLQIYDMREFLELQDYSDKKSSAPIPNKDKTISIEFKDVCYRYPGCETNTLHHFNLKIYAGEKVAVVGVNGAGKTTLVKLLCRFYRPRSGQILINDIDISEFQRDELFTLFSAVFQDILILPFTVAENVALCPDREIDKDRVAHCLELAGLLDYFYKFPKGINAIMLKVTEEDGLLLSGGQQQKLLLARALYKNSPILLLDEPTAALDPIAENELYQKYHMLTQNKTAIFISHRLASTRFCDKIAFIGGGSVKELGSHRELMEKNGEYAKMFEIQSHYYKESISSPQRRDLP